MTVLDMAKEEIEKGWFLRRTLKANRLYSITLWRWWWTIEVVLKKGQDVEGTLIIRYNNCGRDQREIEQEVNFALYRKILVPMMEDK